MHREVLYGRVSVDREGRSTVDEALNSSGTVADLAGTRQIGLLEPGDPDRIGPYDLLCRLPRGGRLSQ